MLGGYPFRSRNRYILWFQLSNSGWSKGMNLSALQSMRRLKTSGTTGLRRGPFLETPEFSRGDPPHTQKNGRSDSPLHLAPTRAKWIAPMHQF